MLRSPEKLLFKLVWVLSTFLFVDERKRNKAFPTLCRQHIKITNVFIKIYNLKNACLSRVTRSTLKPWPLIKLDQVT